MVRTKAEHKRAKEDEKKPQFVSKMEVPFVVWLPSYPKVLC